jgi:RNA polymerase sigma factor (sigma-70 family)
MTVNKQDKEITSDPVEAQPESPVANLPEEAGEVPARESYPTDKTRFLNQLYRAHRKNLCGWLRQRYGAGPPEPEDVVQAAFAKLAALENITHIQHPKTFLYATAMNTALTWVKWIQRTRAFVDHELHRAGEGLDEIAPERVYLAQEKLEGIMRELEALSAKQREIVIRSRFLGQKHREITAATGWSNADISRNLMAAMATIERAVGDEEDETCKGKN